MPHVLVFGSLLALFFLLITRNVSPEPYGYDEADYMYAATLGFAANWSDTPSISMADFLGAGLSRGRDNPKTLSERIRGSHDVLFYRHFHGPLYHYFLIPVSRLGLSERGVRTSLLAIPVASLAVVYFGCLWLLPAPTASLAALLAGMLFLSSRSVVWSTELAPHQLFALCTLACLILLAKAIASKRRAYWYACIIMSALAFSTLEVAFVLILTIAICGFIERVTFGADLRFVVKSLALFLATVLAVWPAAILRLSFVKAYAVVAYLALMRESPWGHAGFIETWRARFFESPLEWVLIVSAVLLGLRNRSRFYPVALFPVALFAGLMILATLRVLSSSARYTLPFMPALDLLAGLTLLPSLGRLRRPASFAVVALAVAGLYGIAWLQVTRPSHNSNPRSAAVLTYIHQNARENNLDLMPGCDLGRLQNLRAIPSGHNRLRRHPQKQAMFHHADHAIQLLVQRPRRLDPAEPAIDNEVAAIGDEGRPVRSRPQRGLGAQLFQLPLGGLPFKLHHLYGDGKVRAQPIHQLGVVGDDNQPAAGAGYHFLA
jgi:Dolichyl-phosphate-mannose-protein mannosyltransferase